MLLRFGIRAQLLANESQIVVRIGIVRIWGVRLRHRLMHDGASPTLLEAITRHRGEASHVIQQFEKLKRPDQEAIIVFLKSL